MEAGSTLLDHLHDDLDRLWSTAEAGDDRSRARRHALTAAKAFVLDERVRHSALS
ncbi:hypothetical protein [Rhodococcus olei]|uniref:hypothetical protein n=1 Tax=Rhodococcus olei TaxID=2161675 RepID=UPI0031E706E1